LISSRARLVQRSLGNQPTALGIREDGQFLVNITIDARTIGEGGAGLAMAAQRHADLQTTRLEHPRQQHESVLDGLGPALPVGQVRQQGRGETPVVPVIEDDPGILGIQIGPTTRRTWPLFSTRAEKPWEAAASEVERKYPATRS
jgi:hypothetical protein